MAMSTRRRSWPAGLVVAALAAGVLAAPAYAGDVPEPAEFTPEGYEFCGWRDLVTREWTMEWDESLAGAYFVAFADGLSCRDARRNAVRVRHGPSGPVRPGYRCTVIGSEHEFSDVRCRKLGTARKFRLRTGA
jgi:hypothetical protein